MASDMAVDSIRHNGQSNGVLCHASPVSPDGGYGWICVAACFTINCFTWGVVSVSSSMPFSDKSHGWNNILMRSFCQSYGVFLAHYLENRIYPGATSTDFAFIGGLNFSVAMLVSPLVTALVRQSPFGIHLPMLIGVCSQTIGFILASFATRIWQLYLTQGFLVGLGVGFTYIPSIAILSQWFDRRRSLANGISAAGSGIGGVLFAFLVRATISNISLAWCLRITGLLSGAMNIMATSVIRSRDNIINPKQHPFDTVLLSRYDVRLVLAWAFISMFGYITILFSMSNFSSSIGLNSSQAATVTALLNMGTAIGRPFIGVISDYYGRIETAAFMTFLCAVSVFAIWTPATSYGVTIFFVVVNGAILGVFWVVGLSPIPHMLILTFE